MYDNTPENFCLGNYPNPFNPTTIITYSLSVPKHVTLKTYDMLGTDVEPLVNEEKFSGTYNVKFDGANFSSGIYLYTLKAGKFNKTRKLILMK
jgi:hypothetical protein